MNSSGANKTGCTGIWHFFASFRADILNKNEILAIIYAKYVENFTVIDQKRSFVRYFNYIIKRPILASQICP